MPSAPRLRTAILLALAASLLTAPALGAGATPAKRVDGQPPINRYAGPVGSSAMHGDPASSDTTSYRGPGADAAAPVTLPLGSVCPTILAGADGMVQALCTEYSDRAPTLYLIDPATMVPVARDHLEAGSLLGGVYAYLDQKDRLVTADGSGRLLFLAHEQTSTDWAITEDDALDLKPAMSKACGSADCDAVVSVAPGYDGVVWFATAAGRAGYADPRTRHVAIRLLGKGEQIANSISTSPHGTAITTDHATYLVRAAHHHVHVVWRRTYDRGSARKPGQLSWGSGATPSFFGPHTGNEFVAMTDNARPREHLLVYRTTTGRRVCSVPILGADNSGTENSPIEWRDRIYVASTYGYPYPAGTSGPSDPASADFVGGMQRFDVTAHGCTPRWTNDVASAAVPKLSVGEHVIYTVGRSADGTAWQVVRISPTTGKVLSSTPLGVGPQSDTLQMTGTFLPDGTLLQGTLTGLVAIRPGG